MNLGARLLACSLIALPLGCATTASVPSTLVGAAVPAAPRARPLIPRRDPSSVVVGELAFEGPAEFAFVDGRTGQALSWAEVQARVKTTSFVIAGEQHDQLPHHRLQAALLSTMADAGTGLAVGLEMVAQPRQPALDKFRRGELDVDGLYAALEWERSWGHDAALYRPIFEAALATATPLIALNTPREVARTVAREGITGLTEEQRAVLPSLDLDDSVHREQLERIFREHHPPTGAGGAFENFYTVQVLWDESMAEGAVRARSGGVRQVLVLAGVGHVAGYHGIPQRILRRVPGASLLTVMPVEVDDGESANEAVRQAIARGEGDILAVRAPREVLRL